MELTSLNNCNLSNQVTTNFACDWSKDGRIFVITDTVVYVLKFVPCMTNIDNFFSFEKSEIFVGEYYPADQTGVDMEEILNSLPREILYRSVLNANLTPKVSAANPAILRPVAASWSPTSLYKNATSLLAVVASTGSVEIYLQKKTKWYCLTNIIPYWIEQLRPTWNFTNTGNNVEAKFHLHAERVLNYTATCVSWSTVYKEDGVEFCYIVLGHASGKISVWKINSIDSSTESIEPIFVHSCIAGDKKITAVHWCSVNESLAWIMYGDIDGLLKCLPVTNVHSETFSTGSIINIYIEKDIRVSFITSVKFQNSEYFVCVKGSHILLTRINNNMKVEFIKLINLGNIAVSGFQPMKPGCFLIVSTTGVLKAVKLVKSESSVDCKIFQIKSDVKWNYHCARGLLKSPNGTLWGLLMYPCKIIDHLLVRQPTQITFCTTTKFDPGTALRANPTMSLANAWECLEIMRCLSAKSNTLACLWLAKCKNYDDFPLYELKIFMWVSISCQAFIQRRPKCRKLKSFVASPTVLRRIVLFKFYLQRLRFLLDLYERNEVNDFQMNSMYMLHDFVVWYGKGEEFEKYLSIKSREELNAVVRRIEEIEFDVPKCYFCRENLTSQPCSSKHPDQRCEVSGVQFVNEGPQWECHICTLGGCSELEEEYLFCPLCDVPFTKYS